MVSSLEKLYVATAGSATSREAVTADISSDHKGDWGRHLNHPRGSHFSGEDDNQASVHEGVAEVTRSNRQRSPF